jgi:hypothetical protein
MSHNTEHLIKKTKLIIETSSTPPSSLSDDEDYGTDSELIEINKRYKNITTTTYR